MKKFILITLLVFIAVSIQSCSGSDESSEEMEIKDPKDPGGDKPNPAYPLSDQSNIGKWLLNTQISDEFEAPLDESKWLIQGRNNEYQSNFIGRAPSQFSTNNAITESGKLKIITKWEPSFPFTNDAKGNMLGVYDGVAKPITTAAVISKKQFKYGYMEIKCKSANAPITSSFWTTGKNTSELDMFEMFGGHKTNTSWKKRLKFNIISWDPDNPNYFPKNDGPVFTQNIQVKNNTADDFHVYGFNWTADFIKVYYDGELMPEFTILKTELTNNGANPDKWVTDSDYWIWFDSETFPWLGIPTAADLPAEYQIEYLRVWQRN